MKRWSGCCLLLSLDSTDRLHKRGQINRSLYGVFISVITRKGRVQTIVMVLFFFLLYLPEWKTIATPNSPWLPCLACCPWHPVCAVAVCALFAYFSITLLGKIDPLISSWETTGYDLTPLEGQLKRRHLPSNSCQGRLWGWTRLPGERKTWRGK